MHPPCVKEQSKANREKKNTQQVLFRESKNKKQKLSILLFFFSLSPSPNE